MEDKEKTQPHKPEGELLVALVNHDPMGSPIYHPAIGKGAIWGGIIGGAFIGFIAYLVASGHYPVVGLGQLSAPGNGAPTFLGFVLGSAVGGLTGSLIGLRRLLLHHKPSLQ